ncbi:MAG: SIMPL domain-containing protein [Bryobacteraceae bacterium]|nr:SIMPL domain-containing protein [Bryobacteraceae bacterium]MDW8380001.1 SIMPL domain-containing protein [Bryobacterales bacterium]
MARIISTVVLVSFSCGMVWAQTAQRRPFVRASGEGVVSTRPDQVKVIVNCTAQGSTAQEATEAVASQAASVISALTQLLGSRGDVRTVGVSVSPQYRYPQGQPPQLTGYQATNTLEVTVEDLTLAGRTIDRAVQAGASSIGGLQFGLKDPNPVRNQALRAATQQARQSAEAIALGLGARLGSVIMASESGVVLPVITEARAPGVTASAPTPIEPGTVQVRASVTIEVELAQ